MGHRFFSDVKRKEFCRRLFKVIGRLIDMLLEPTCMLMICGVRVCVWGGGGGGREACEGDILTAVFLGKDRLI